DLMETAYVLLKEQIPAEFKLELFASMPTESNKNRTLLQKHLADYVARNTFDYFIHKDLKGFLSRELDFYIKNEILEIDDIDARSTDSFLAHLTVIKAIKNVGNKIIEFLASLENFQKRLWLKKKMVVSTDYCITLDRVPEELYAEICANDAQREEWVRLFAIDEIKESTGYSIPLTVKFLKENPFLVLDTAFFNEEFKRKLISEIDNLDEQCDGLLINSENFQALELLQEKYKGIVNTIITDPPYNTGEDDFLYKDNYVDSSWLTMMNDRMMLMYTLLSDNSWCSININDIELFNLMKLLEPMNWSSRTNLTVKMSHLSGMKMSHIDKKIPKIKESIVILSKGADFKLNPIYEQCSWDDAFKRYDSWVDKHNSKDPKDWTRKSVRQAAEEHGIDINDQARFDLFRIQNADKIYQRAKNDYFNDYPHDDIFREVITSTGLKKYVLNAKEVLFASTYLNEINGKKVPAQPKGDIWDDIGINNVHNEGGVQLPNGKKPVKLFERLISLFSNGDSIALDPFAGSATLAHAVMNVCERDKAKHKYVLIQDGYQYFDEKTKRRVENVIYSNEWKLDKPTSRKGCSHCFKYMRLEQYEDTLNNLVARENTLMNQSEEFYEEYMLGYLLDTETKDSLFSLDWFVDPWNTKLKITCKNEMKEEKIDLVETFNYLIGLKVKKMSYPKDTICVVEGNNRKDEHILVIWRNCKEISNEKLNEFFQEMDYLAKGNEFDKIYVNGDNNLENLKADTDTWIVRLIEQEFSKRMFETE
ncbi:MAG: site-specific DNA-methyltransferase, partial [Prevotella sp.]|nr:site-specific DNA-methyltransferase [Prevotella sp.]